MLEFNWQKYPVYKSSGVEWLGDIPEHWEVMTFRRICRLQQGLQIAQSNRFIEPGTNRFEYITIKSINAGETNTNKEYIENPPLSVICYPDDILVARTGATGEVVSDQLGVFHNNFFKVCYQDKKVKKQYLLYYLKSSQIKKYLLLLAGTTTIPDLNHGEFLDTIFVLPPFSEQQAIANFLDNKIAQIDEYIAKKQRMIELLKEQKTVIINQAVTKGLNPDVPMKFSGIEWLGEIPEHWEVRKNKTLFRLFNGYAFKGEFFAKNENDFPIIVTPGNFFPGAGLYFTKENTTHYLEDYPSEYKLKLGDRLIVMTDLSYKKLILGQCVTANRENLLLNQRVAKIIINKLLRKKLKPDFLQYSLNSFCVREQVIFTARGSTVFHSSPDKIGQCLVCLPPLDEQQEIVSFIEKKSEKIERSLATIEKEIKLIQEYRTTLISETVTGKIDVRKYPSPNQKSKTFSE